MAVAVALLVGSGLLAPVLLDTLSAAPAGAVTASGAPAYWLVASDGGIFAFGGAPFYGSMGGQHLNEPIVGVAGASTGGYWEVASDGGIFAFGAPFYGSMGGQHLNKPIVAMAATPDGNGYWLVASDGGIFTFGDAAFYGSMGGQHLNEPIVGMAPTTDGKGYWLVASDGGIFAFGDAPYEGSMGGRQLVRPIVGMAPATGGTGYWELASDGGIFAFGDAQYEGSLGGVPQNRPIAAIASNPAGTGYWMTNTNGAVTAFGSATYWGSAPQVLDEPVVAMAEATGTGAFTGGPFPSGSFGYDVSNYQCNSPLPPAPHTIGVVQVEQGESFSATNPCLSSEASWAGGGLNLYVFLTYGTALTSPDGACASTESPTSCNYGFEAAVDAFTKAQAAGVNTNVAWWLDVENYAIPLLVPWATDTAANASLVQGAIDGLHYEGLNSVGIYISVDNWQALLGTYSPSVPLWIAWYSVGGGPYNCANAQVQAHSAGSFLPPGSIILTQYADTVNGQSIDGDYAC